MDYIERMEHELVERGSKADKALCELDLDKEYSTVEKKWKNRHSDKKLHEKYRKIYGKDIPKSFG